MLVPFFACHCLFFLFAFQPLLSLMLLAADSSSPSSLSSSFVIGATAAAASGGWWCVGQTVSFVLFLIWLLFFVFPHRKCYFIYL